MADALLQEDGSSYILQEDGTSKILLDNTPTAGPPTPVPNLNIRLCWIAGPIQLQSITTGSLFCNVEETEAGKTLIQEVTLVGGVNVITVPPVLTSLALVLMTPPSTNTLPLYVLGTATDTGVEVSSNRPSMLPVSQGSFYIQYSSTSFDRLLEDFGVRLLEDNVSRRLLESST